MKRFFAMLLALIMILNMPVCVYALHKDEGRIDVVWGTDSVVSVNPVYEGIVSEEHLLKSIECTAYNGDEDDYVDTYEEAGEILKKQLKERKNPITVNFAADTYDSKYFGELLNAAYVHTGDPDEGDYIRYNNIGYSGTCGWWYNDRYYITYSYTMSYCSTAQQETEVDKKVDSVIASLNLAGKSQYEKIKAIYDYICKNVTYDYANLNDPTYILKFGTYAALINGTAVCQGYSTLFYRLALEAGIDARVITGIGNGGPHAWNIVEISDLYYNLDSTWDAGRYKYSYFLTSEDNFDDHYRDYEYDNSAFHAAYPMSESNYDPSQQVSDIIASGYCGGGPGGTNLSWSINKKGVLTISGTGVMADFISGDAPWKNYTDKFSTIVIEEGVTEIGDRAFYGLKNLKGNLKLPKSLKIIGVSAFQDCTGLSGDLIIPDGVTVIETRAFENCSGFNGNLVLPDSLTTIGNYAFSRCSGFKGDLVIPENIKTIPYGAFEHCTGFNGNLVIPNGVTTIENYAFNGCSGFTGELSLPNSITEIKDSAFQGCSGFTGNLVIPRDIKILYNNIFYNCSGFDGKLVIPEGVKEIWNNVFTNCSGLTGNLVIPKSVESIGSRVFEGCSGFTGNLVIPEGITNIGSSAFMNCSGFTGDLVIPEGITSIWHSTFKNCSGFDGKLVIPKSVSVITIESFKGCSGLTGDIVIPEGVIRIQQSSFEGCSGFDGKLIIPESVTVIENDAFNGCSGLTGDLVIPKGVTSVKNGAFKNCSGFTGKLVISEGVETIGDGVFYGCSGLSGDIVIPDSVTAIGYETFFNCSGFDGEILFSKNLKILEDSLFEGCSGLNKDIVIPANITHIRGYAFKNCSADNFYFEGDAPFVHTAYEESASFDKNKDTIYYHGEANGWDVDGKGKWKGYNAVKISGEPEILYGDVNGDGSVNVMDANLVRKYAAKLAEIEEERKDLADVDGSGKINIIDANYIRRFAAHLINEFPAGND